ncbi:polysaccharide pyruvyl transferase family protein [Vibrio breoganii]|uniref:polysaccharide pyruvyl transferase family protein n=1 Tax=Vibrio breoganii TaxID=553239 RepID=UPI000C836F08|nr:polysaccharide pyruvyl transferase family protein [Vibrio breoganii]PMG10462.1 hypothetical protein BCV00_18445 [Vibrio breoganii]
MKKIIVLRIPNAKNNGSAMMAINSISHFHSQFEGDVEFLCDFASLEDKDRVVAELDSDTKVSSLEMPKFDRGSSLVSSFINRQKWIKAVVNLIKSHDPVSILVLGGDDFSEYYSGYKIVVRLFFMYRLTQQFPVYLIGHTIGPFTSWRKNAFGFLMAKARIVTRDEQSLAHLRNDLSHKHSSQGHDLAWFNLPMQNDDLKLKMLNKYDLKENNFIVITPSALVKHYCDSETDYLAAWQKLAETLVKQDKTVVFMPHVFNNVKRDDRGIIELIKQKVPTSMGVKFIEDMLLPSECRAIVSACHFSIACRMHAAVSTLQTGKPSIALSYSVKYAGVIGGDMQLPELVIESADSSLWRSNIVESIVEKIEFVEDNHQSLCNRISTRVAQIQAEQAEIMNSCGEQMLRNKGAVFVD